MKRTAIGAVLVAVTVLLATGDAPAQQSGQEAEEALLGFDPIELIGGVEALGSEQIAAEYNGLRYLFVSEENRELFASDPQRYGIQMGNLCARLGRTTGGDQDLYTVFEGRIYIFASDQCVERFEADPERYLEPPALPPLRETASTDELERGGKLVALALDALGGAAAVDGLENFVEQTALLRPDSGKPTEAASTLTVDFAHHRMRRDQDYGGRGFAQVWSLDEAWWQGFGSTGTYSPAQAENLGKEMLVTYPAYILRMRGHERFAAASRGVGSAEVLEHVEVELGDYRWTLGIDPDTGMLASVTFIDRGPEGNWGELTYFLTDYRMVDGINWPFRRIVTFDGEALPWWSSETRALQINAELDNELWTRPEGAAR